MKYVIFAALWLVASLAISEDWQTHAERTAFQETSRYPEVIEYCQKLAANSPWIRYGSFGQSPLSRDLPLLIVSSQQLFTPEEVRRSGAIVFLIINGIHAGEIAGKEASLMLVRDIAITKQKSALLDNVVLLVVPIYSVDGHERFGPYNRINQNGPKEMGWRTTSVNLNLNRDWLKADQVETRAMLKLFHTWLPDFIMDNHVTDGADFQYDVMHIFEDSEALASPLRDFLKQDYEPFVMDYLKTTGHTPTFYFEPVDASNPAAGIVSGPSSPRFSNGYTNAQNRPGIVAETHMLKPFSVRVKAHYDLMEGTLKLLNSKKDALNKAISQSEDLTIRIGKNRSPFPLKFELDKKQSTPTKFHGLEYKRQMSPISGEMAVSFGTKPVEMTIPWFRSVVPVSTVIPPVGYAIPPQWTFAKERLEIHGIRFHELTKPVTSKFETYRFQKVSWPDSPFEGRHAPNFEAVALTEERTLPAGSMIVWLDQRTNQLILHLLEPQSPDSLLSWGFFNAIFEQKEYAENYVLEKLAADMLKRDPALKEEFEERIKKDAQFAASPSARLNFFYQKSPYWDQQKGAYPVVRITDQNQIPQDSIR